MPIVHEAAYSIDTRASPYDGGNLARVSPGDPAGAPTARLGHALQTCVLEALHAPQDGWVVVLKRRPHVRPGDPVLGAPSPIRAIASRPPPRRMH